MIDRLQPAMAPPALRELRASVVNYSFFGYGRESGGATAASSLVGKPAIVEFLTRKRSRNWMIG
jgi:hypothetical protein